MLGSIDAYATAAARSAVSFHDPTVLINLESAKPKLMVALKVFNFANAFGFRFFKQEHMVYTCTVCNDFFVTMLDTTWQPRSGGPGIPSASIPTATT